MTDLEERTRTLKQLKFRSAHRGVAEMDQLLGTFARQALDGLTAAQLAQYQALLDAPDWDAYGWLTGQVAVPEALAEIVALVVRSAPQTTI